MPETDEERYIEELTAIKTGPRSFTAEQAEFIKQVVAERKPLDVEPLPLSED